MLSQFFFRKVTRCNDKVSFVPQDSRYVLDVLSAFSQGVVRTKSYCIESALVHAQIKLL